MTKRKPVVSPPPLPLSWYLAYARLIGARLLERLLERLPPGIASRALAGLAMVMMANAVWTYPRAFAGVDPLQVALGHQPVTVAVVNFVIQLIIIIVAAILAVALRPKPKDPEVATAQVPVVEDGKGIIRICGTVWVDDSIVLGWKQMGTIKIKSKTGKKG